MTKAQLRLKEKISMNKIATMRKDQDVCVEVLAKISNVLDCTTDDIIKVLLNETPETKNPSNRTGDNT